MVEDSVPDAELAIWRLTQGGYRCRYRVVTHEEAFLKALEERLPSFILSDFSLLLRLFVGAQCQYCFSVIQVRTTSKQHCWFQFRF